MVALGAAAGNGCRALGFSYDSSLPEQKGKQSNRQLQPDTDTWKLPLSPHAPSPTFPKELLKSRTDYRNY